MKRADALASMEVEMKRLKGYFPYRIVYGALDPETNEYETGAVTTMREPNKLLRKGYEVYKL